MNKISKFLIFLTVLFALSAIFMFSRMGWTDGSVNGLIQNLKDENSQATIESMLADKGEAAVEPLIEALKNENTNIAKGAAEVLGMIKDVRAVEPL
ncbi:MAG: HEAT repeat domain-containing protein, partial [Actinobacteria bacterium]|nr:HEAT repeat domain-containing protein [Actinomycetota bacterium]